MVKNSETKYEYFVKLTADNPRVESLITKAQAILFDFDRTLYFLNVDWASVKAHFYELGQKKYGINLSTSRFYRIFEIIRDNFGEDSVKRDFLDYLKEKEWDSIRSNPPTPLWLIKEGIYILKKMTPKNAIYGIISSNFHATIEETLKINGQSGLFDIILGRDDVDKAKPDPEGILKIIKEYKIHPQYALFSGDNIADENAAKAAGIPFIDAMELEKFLKNRENHGASVKDN